MARKREEPQSPEGGWINTFADLMNLLLCFFVLLFSMSTVDADKYEQLVTSMTESINIFSGGGSAVGEGAFVSSGTDQMVAISNYFNEFEKSGEEDDEDKDQPTPSPGQQGTQSQDPQNVKITDDIKKMVESQEQNQLKKRTEKIYENIMEESRNRNVEDQISVNMDKKYQYVQISMNGALLFDSGAAEIKKSTMPLLNKVGDILKLYDSHLIKIEGHTDNVPISTGKYRNNMWLSTARATEVFEYLKEKKGLTPKSMEATGRSFYDKIASNDTEKGRARNRRVEIKIYTDE